VRKGGGKKKPAAKRTVTPKGEVSTMTVGFETSRIIGVLADIYGDVESVINELVQNVIDTNAARGIVTLNLKTRKLTTLDDGDGTSIEEMRNRIGKLGARVKGPEDIGEKGLGNLAPISIARKYSMITHPKGRRLTVPFFRIDFDRALLDTQDGFNCTTLPGFRFQEAGWTTSVAISGIEKSALRGAVKDPHLLDKLCDNISSAFGLKLKQKKLRLTVRVVSPQGQGTERVVVPQEFPGKREEISIQTKRGPVVFELFLTRSQQKTPKILVDHQEKFSFPLKNMADIWSQVSDVFGSGHFQGRIKVNFCEISDDRKRFEWSDALEEFIEAIFKFANDYGRPWLQKLVASKDLEMFEEIGLNVLSAADQIVKENPELLSTIFKGSVSTGHVDIEAVDAIKKTLRTRKRREVVPPLKPDEEEPKKPVTPRRKKTVGRERDMTHPAVESPTGTERRALSGQSGLQIIAGESETWRIQIGTEGEEKGKIVISISHPDWQKSQDRGKAALDTYMRMLVMMVLATPFMPDSRAKVFQQEYEGVFLQFREMITPMIPKR